MHLDLISIYTNLNTYIKLAENEDREEKKGKSDIIEQSEGDTNQN